MPVGVLSLTVLSACAEEHSTVGTSQFSHRAHLVNFFRVPRRVADFSTVGVVFELLVGFLHRIETNIIMASR